jgi:hypothetical protein
MSGKRRKWVSVRYSQKHGRQVTRIQIMYQKDNQIWAPWDTPIIMATWQAETGEL